MRPGGSNPQTTAALVEMLMPMGTALAPFKFAEVAVGVQTASDGEPVQEIWTTPVKPPSGVRDKL